MLRITSIKYKASLCGFTLIEVLIAIVVLSLGLLGFAALQVNALKSAHDSYQSTVANVIAKDAKERLWAKLLKAQEYDGSTYVACPSNSDVDYVDADGNAVSRMESLNDEAQSDWAGSNVLPGRVVSIGLGDDFCEYVIDVSWSARFDSEYDSGLKNFKYYVRLPGYEFKTMP